MNYRTDSEYPKNRYECIQYLNWNLNFQNLITETDRISDRIIILIIESVIIKTF